MTRYIYVCVLYIKCYNPKILRVFLIFHIYVVVLSKKQLQALPRFASVLKLVFREIKETGQEKGSASPKSVRKYGGRSYSFEQIEEGAVKTLNNDY